MNAKIRCKFGTNDTNGATQLCGHVFNVDVPRYSPNDIFKLLVASVHHKKEYDEHRDKVYTYFQRLREIIQHYNEHTTMTLVNKSDAPGAQFHCDYAGCAFTCAYDSLEIYHHLQFHLHFEMLRAKTPPN